MEKKQTSPLPKKKKLNSNKPCRDTPTYKQPFKSTVEVFEVLIQQCIYIQGCFKLLNSFLPRGVPLAFVEKLVWWY